MPIPLPNPGDVVASVWGQEVARDVNSLVDSSGTFTPTLVGLVIGTGGGNQARYTFIGGHEVGDTGILMVDGIITLGSAGFSVVNTTASIPPGFTRGDIGSTNTIPYGMWRSIGHASAFMGIICLGADVVNFLNINVSATFASVSALSGTSPETWGAADSLAYSYCIPAKRV